MSKKISLILSILVATSFHVSFASENTTDYHNFENRRQFEKKVFFMPSEEEKLNIKEIKQMLLDHTIGESIDPSIMTFKIVEGIPEIHDWLIKSQPAQDTHWLTLLDLDEALFPGSALAWVDCVFDRLDQLQNKVQICHLLLQYGFSSQKEFKSWGATITPTPESRAGNSFSCQYSILDEKVPGILKQWRERGMNIFGLTSRTTNEESLLMTQESFKEAGVNFSSLSDILITREELPFTGKRTFDAGVIYTEYPFKKYGEDSAANTFLEVYLSKLLSGKTEQIKFLNIIAVDDRRFIHGQVASEASICKLRKLEQTFNLKIHVHAFLPYENVWLSPCFNWPTLGQVFEYLDANNVPIPSFNDKVIFPSLGNGYKEQIVFNALKDYLETFASERHREQPLPGPFIIDRRNS